MFEEGFAGRVLTFVVTFERGQERSEEWLEQLARESVEAIFEQE